MRGTVLTDGDEGFEQRCSGWNLLRAHRPSVVVAATGAHDVSVAVRFATDQGIGLGVHATGHGMALPVDGVLIDTREMTGLMVDPDRRTATIGAGCTWGEVLAVTQREGLAPLLGSSPTVGAVGYTLGGGLGWLARKHGAACDTVRWFEVVTPDAAVRRVGPDEDPDLFRGLRGGGGAFGVVTAMEVDLVPVDTVYAGNLYYPPDRAADIAAAFGEWVSGVPDELTSSFVCQNAPPAPVFPEQIRGRSLVVVRGCWSGDLEQGEALLDEWRSQTSPLFDHWGAMSFADCASISADRIDPAPAVVTGEWIYRCDAGVGRALAEATFPVDDAPLLVFSEVRHLGGAVVRGDRSATSFGHRDHPFFMNTVGVSIDRDPTPIADHQRQMLRSLGNAATGAAYLNYLDQDERRHRTGDAFEAGVRTRLAALQHRHDAGGLLRYGADHRL